MQHLPFAQALDLSLLVDLEARWENLRSYKAAASERTSTLKELHQKQKAHEAFIAKLVIYNKLHKPAHVAELLLNTPSRLGKWCGTMRDLVQQVQHDAHAHCPTDLLAKAYRWADHVAGRMRKSPIKRPTPSMTIPAVIQELEELALWCDSLSGVAS